MESDAIVLRALLGKENLILPILEKQTDLSKQDIQKSIQSWQKIGYDISFHPQLGYSLRQLPDVLITDEIQARLPNNLFAQKLTLLRETASTNDLLIREANQGAPEGRCIGAETQTAGRGRQGRKWESGQPLGLWISLLVRPMWPAFTMQRLNIIASLATAQTIERFSRSSASIKWPNDVQLKGKKIAGILTESGIDQEILSHAVIGIGININHGKEDFQNNLQSSATSLYLASDQKIRRADVLVYLLEQFETLYNKPFHELVEPWRGRCVTIGQRLQTTLNNQSVIGTMMDIDTDGGLVLRLGSGKLVTLHSGEVTPA